MCVCVSQAWHLSRKLHIKVGLMNSAHKSFGKAADVGQVSRKTVRTVRKEIYSLSAGLVAWIKIRLHGLK